ncbi:MAG: RHS repeat domain-containing protein [Weeksellaceae bacterium]
MEHGRRNEINYLSAFQYKDGVLAYIQHAEGYINVERRSKIDDLPDLPPNFPIRPGFPTDPRFPILVTNGTPVNDMGAVRPIYDGGGLQRSDEFHYEFAYVYHYKDHLDNIRLSYTDKNGDGKISDYTNEIIDENNYYPFGLEHEGYNGKESGYKYKYQEQERQDELGLNWDSFKWRNYDYALGRFMSVDPLAEDYVYNSTYAFQENKMGMGRELEGLELEVFDWLEEKAVEATDYIKENIVVEAKIKGSIGVQAGIKTAIGRVEGGIITAEIGTLGYSTSKGNISEAGDGKGHNFAGIGGKVLSDKLSASAKVDYITDSIIPPEGSDLGEYYGSGENGEWQYDGGVGPNIGIGPKTTDGTVANTLTSGQLTPQAKLECNCLTLEGGAKLIFGLDISISFGFKKDE